MTACRRLTGSRVALHVREQGNRSLSRAPKVSHRVNPTPVTFTTSRPSLERPLPASP